MSRTIIIKIIIIPDKTFTFSGLVRLREKCVLLLIGDESEHEIVPNLSHTNIHTMCAHCCCCHRYQHTTLYASIQEQPPPAEQEEEREKSSGERTRNVIQLFPGERRTDLFLKASPAILRAFAHFPSRHIHLEALLPCTHQTALLPLSSIHWDWDLPFPICTGNYPFVHTHLNVSI